ncbi:Carbonic anhydrase [Winogradskyella psychrotolerans RS-3]|uniref:carbonic anhydrase n=1 Tax=Winogradskyella psychrotolerans RS-3 TaxID=641526 RepID=S7VX64_9FLAO|nr:Carbonic anhydrase [Winogradskyella psychrotolerans RS-3]
MDLNNVFKNNEKWIKDRLDNDAEYFEKLGQGQNPELLFIGCSDSRVTAEELMGLGPGDVFVHRNIANMVVGTDANGMSVVNYAVTHLKVNHVVVCGHYACGGVKAAMQSADLGVLNGWLRNIRDVYRMHHNELNSIKDEEKNTIV